MLYKYDVKELQFKPISLKQYIYFVIGLLLLFSTLSSGITTKIVYEKIPVVIKTDKIPFSEDNLRREINTLHLKFSSAVYNQAIIEGASRTGDRWKNPIFINGNNFLGLKRAYARPSTAISWGKDDYCIYSDWQECLRDYALWQAQNLSKINTEQEYIQFLDQMGYSIDSNYTKLIKKIK